MNCRSRNFIVLTSIHEPTVGVKEMASRFKDWQVVCVGDKRTPQNWQHDGVIYLSTEEQSSRYKNFAERSAHNHYSRKNLGYLFAIENGANVIADADDDQTPLANYLSTVDPYVQGGLLKRTGWTNIYSWFSDLDIWPRGLPFEHVRNSSRNSQNEVAHGRYHCPIQQFLVDGEPDVDAVCRLTIQQKVTFAPGDFVLGKDSYCPFNSQNTLWWPETFPLLYLPNFATFRMTDIWRSFVAQICLYAAGMHLAFRDATVRHERNVHSLEADIKDEIPGYLNNHRIMEMLAALDLSPNPKEISSNILRCYEALHREKLVSHEEVALVSSWLEAVGAAFKCSEVGVGPVNG